MYTLANRILEKQYNLQFLIRIKTCQLRNIHTSQVPSTLETGLEDLDTEMAKLFLKMAHHMKENGILGRHMAKVFLNGLVEMCMRVIGIAI